MLEGNIMFMSIPERNYPLTIEVLAGGGGGGGGGVGGGGVHGPVK